MTDLSPEAAALRDAAIAPVHALIEACEIEHAWTAVEIEHARSKHPSSWPEETASDLDAIAAGEVGPATKTVEQLELRDWIRVAGEWCRVEVIRPSVLTVRREHSACEWEYPVTEGETFAWHPGGF